MTARIAPNGVHQFLDNNGFPLAGGKVYTYAAGTTTPQQTWTDAAQTTPNANPVILDSAGRAVIFWSGIYKVVVKTSADVTLSTVDNMDTTPAVDATQVNAALTQSGIGTKLWPQTSAESTAGVTPANYYYAPGVRERYATLADAVAVCATHTLYLSASETITASITLPANAMIVGINRPQITNSTNGSHVFDATSKATITIQGVRFKGNSASTVPSTGFGGYSAANNGLVTITSCTDVRIRDCEFDTFYNGLTVQNCDRVWIEDNRVRVFTFIGILASSSTYFCIDRNVVTECQQAGAVVSYGITATGDQAGGNTQERCSISSNKIDGVPSWAGIMTHDVDGIDIIGNDIRNVRRGIDVGHLLSTNFVRNVKVALNYIKSTTTNTWGGTGAEICGIGVAGFNDAVRVAGANISDNIIENFFTTVMTVGGNPSNIIVAYCDDAHVHDNTVKGAGSASSNAGIRLQGTCQRFSISRNNLQGDFTQCGIRVNSVVASFGVLTDNIIDLTTPAVGGIYVDGTTNIGSLVRRGNISNGEPWTLAAGTVVLGGQELEGSATYDPPSLADGAGATTTVTVTGAALGDTAVAAFGGDVSGMTVTAYVSAANTVSVRFQNESGGVLDLGSSTLRVRVFKKVA